MSFYDEPPPEWDDDYWMPEEPPDETAELLRDIAEQMGIADYDDLVVDLSQVQDPENIRGVRFGSLEEAVIFLFQIGVLSFSNVLLIDDLYVPVIHDSPAPTT